MDMIDMRLEAIASIAEGTAAMAHYIRSLLWLLGWREPSPASETGSNI
jgi:hypothetical protein